MTASPTFGRAADRRTAGPRVDVRVGDRERTAAADRLAAHAAAGRLTVEELEQRVERAHAAVVRRDLDAVLADLPEPRGRRAAVRRAPVFLTALTAAVAATVALSLVVGHPLPPLFLLALLAWRRFA